MTSAALLLGQPAPSLTASLLRQPRFRLCQWGLRRAAGIHDGSSCMRPVCRVQIRSLVACPLLGQMSEAITDEAAGESESELGSATAGDWFAPSAAARLLDTFEAHAREVGDAEPALSLQQLAACATPHCMPAGALHSAQHHTGARVARPWCAPDAAPTTAKHEAPACGSWWQLAKAFLHAGATMGP